MTRVERILHESSTARAERTPLRSGGNCKSFKLSIWCGNAQRFHLAVKVAALEAEGAGVVLRAFCVTPANRHHTRSAGLCGLSYLAQARPSQVVKRNCQGELSRLNSGRQRGLRKTQHPHASQKPRS